MGNRELIGRLKTLAAEMRNMADEWASREIGDKYDAIAAATYRNDAELLEQAALALSEARKDEREACAKIVDGWANNAFDTGKRAHAEKIAQAIRSRSPEGEG